MQLEEIIISAFVTIFSLGLLAVSLASYRKYRNMKLLFVSLVFLIFLVKGILMSLSLFFGDIVALDSILYNGLIDLGILLLLFIATLKR